MDTTWLLVLSLFFSSSIILLFLLAGGKGSTGKGAKRKGRLPPGPPAFPVIGNLLWLKKNIVVDLEPVLRDLFKQYGPIVTVRIGSRLGIFIADRHVAHRALVSLGAAFSNRPTPLPASRFLSGNQLIISSAAYGPLWRLLRRNLISEILSPTRIKLYAPGRNWVLSVLLNHLRRQSALNDGGAVVAMESFQFAMFCLLALMCYGEKLGEDAIREIEVAHRQLLLFASSLNVLNFFPAISKYVFRRRLETAATMLKRQTAVVLPLIQARREHKKTVADRSMSTEEDQELKERYVYSYLDSLLDVKLPDEGGRSLTEDEVVALTAEFLNAGTDTTSTALQWIMAELVLHPEVQDRIVSEINEVVTKFDEVDGTIREEDLQKMPYVKAVVLEGLRRHPPAHFALPHAMTEEAELEGYVIPKRATVNFMVADMQWDETVWEDPMEFRPERFLTGGGERASTDITGSKEIKMMPFGVGRRICPGLALAMLHLEYFVANLVREFEWRKVEGEEVDMAEKSEFTVVMRTPLRARLIPRRTAAATYTASPMK